MDGYPYGYEDPAWDGLTAESFAAVIAVRMKAICGCLNVELGAAFPGGSGLALASGSVTPADGTGDG